MARQLKCQVCSTKEIPIYGDKIDMVKEGKVYMHLLNCHQVYLEEQIQKENDAPHWSALFEYLKVLHNVITIPSRNIKRLHALRDGDDIKGAKKYKRFRQGASYELMLEAYIVAEDKIKWFMNNVLSGDDTPSDISACITMMIDHGLNQAWKNRQQKKKRDEENEKISKMQTEDNRSTESPVIYKKKNDDMDISHLL